MSRRQQNRNVNLYHANNCNDDEESASWAVSLYLGQGLIPQ